MWARAAHHLPQRCGLALELPGGRAMWVFFWNSFVPVGGDKKGQKPNGNVAYLNKKKKNGKKVRRLQHICNQLSH